MPTFALLVFPILPLILFAALGPAKGLIWSVGLGYLFLPENFGFDLPGLPPYDKRSAITFGLILPALLYWARAEKLPSVDTRVRTAIWLCLALLAVRAVGTSITNPETLFDGPIVRSGLTQRDIISLTFDSLLWFVPFFLAWHFLKRPEDQRHVLVALVALGLVYTLLVLFELRMSPQLNKWIYGYFPHNWRQHLRAGGYRPIVFLRHGLWVGFLLFSVVIAAMALSRDRPAERPLYLAVGIWAFLVLALSRNMGATLLAVALAPVVLVLTARAQVRVAAVTAILLISYPILSQSSLTPASKLLEIVKPIAPDRAESFQFRLDNEALLIERAYQKPLFGWGGYSRQRLIDERGRDLTVTDGLWIIQLGQGGWVGYLGFFGMLTVPALFLRRAARRKPIPPVIAGMAAIMAGNYLYMVPNSTLNPIAFLILGSLAAFVQYDAATEGETAEPAPDRGEVRYSRFTPGHREGSAPAQVPGQVPGQAPVSASSRVVSRPVRSVRSAPTRPWRQPARR